MPLALTLAAAAVFARSSGMYWRVLLTRADGLALGALLAALFTGRKAIHEHPAVPKVFAAIGLVAFAYLAVLIASGGMAKPEAPPWPGPSLLAVNVLGAAVVGLVIYFQGRPGLAVLRRPRLVKIGQLSYGLYIYHYVLMLLSDDIARAFGMGGRPFWREALTAAVIYAVAALSWRYVELPLAPPQGPLRLPPHRAGRGVEAALHGLTQPGDSHQRPLRPPESRGGLGHSPSASQIGLSAMRSKPRPRGTEVFRSSVWSSGVQGASPGRSSRRGVIAPA